MSAYKTVYDLSADELAELKGNYFWELADQGENEFDWPEDIPDDVIYAHYEGIDFVDDDFFCNVKDGNYEGCGAACAGV